VRASLYDEAAGYFTRRGSAVVGALPQPLRFGALGGEADYRVALRAAYDALGTSWLTPSEIFRPHYANALADTFAASHMARHPPPTGCSSSSGGGERPPPPPLVIYEVGGGSGSVARDVLLRLRERNPGVFLDVRYRAVEISPQLAERQAATVAAGGTDLSARFEALVGDATLPETWAGAGGAAAREEECHVFGLEVLDNLPHDLVRRRAGGAWEEALVVPRAAAAATTAAPSSPAVEGGGWEGAWQPLQDPLVERCLGSHPWEEATDGSLVDRALRLVLEGALGPAPADGRVFLPTGCLQLLETLCEVRPRHHLLLADFDALPETVIPGRNAPLVSDTSGGRARDFDSFLLPYGSADIFFPTDFEALKALHAAAARRAGLPRAGEGLAAEPQGAFLRRACPEAARAAATQSGYNPLLEDFQNTCVFTAGY
jgi:hypothetical protein